MPSVWETWYDPRVFSRVVLGGKLLLWGEKNLKNIQKTNEICYYLGGGGRERVIVIHILSSCHYSYTDPQFHQLALVLPTLIYHHFQCGKSMPTTKIKLLCLTEVQK